jgi:hypothetical protein
MEGRWCNIVLSVHVPRENDDSNDSFDEEKQQVFDHFSPYNMKILSGVCNAKSGNKDIFNPTFGIGSLRRDSNDNGFRTVNFTYLHHKTESCWRSSSDLS